MSEEGERLSNPFASVGGGGGGQKSSSPGGGDDGQDFLAFRSSTPRGSPAGPGPFRPRGGKRSRRENWQRFGQHLRREEEAAAGGGAEQGQQQQYQHSPQQQQGPSSYFYSPGPQQQPRHQTPPQSYFYSPNRGGGGAGFNGSPNFGSNRRNWRQPDNFGGGNFGRGGTPGSGHWRGHNRGGWNNSSSFNDSSFGCGGFSPGGFSPNRGGGGRGRGWGGGGGGGGQGFRGGQRGGGRGRGRGGAARNEEYDVGNYAHPSMLSDPWAALERQRGFAAAAPTDDSRNKSGMDASLSDSMVPQVGDSILLSGDRSSVSVNPAPDVKSPDEIDIGDEDDDDDVDPADLPYNPDKSISDSLIPLVSDSLLNETNASGASTANSNDPEQADKDKSGMDQD